jgi:ArsR family transcriptional regulator
MTNEIKNKFEYRAEILKALAHPTRLFIVDVLSKKEHCVCELTEMIGDDTSTISKHLTVLKNAGIVKMEKRARNIYYKLNCPCILNFLDCIDNVIEKNALCHLDTLK